MNLKISSLWARPVTLIVCAVALLAQSAPAMAAIAGHGRQVTVTQIISYPESGEVYFLTPDLTPGCEGGYWMRPSDTGFKSAYATLLMVYANKSPIRLWAYDDSLWQGSTSKVCRLYAINPV